MPSGRTKGKRHKPKYRKVYLNIRKGFFTMRVAEYRSRLPREAAESLSLELLRTQLDVALTNLLPLTVL